MPAGKVNDVRREVLPSALISCPVPRSGWGTGRCGSCESRGSRFYFDRSPEKTSRALISHEFGPESDEILGVFFGDVESDKWDFTTARFELVARLLDANYNLTKRALPGTPLWLTCHNPENEAMWTALGPVLAGASPKPTPAT